MRDHLNDKGRLLPSWTGRALVGIATVAALLVTAHGASGVAYSNDPRLNPLAAQCGFHALYLILRARGHPVSMADLISDFGNDERVQREGLSFEDIRRILVKHGERCRVGTVSKDTFRRLPSQGQFMIMLVDAKQLHFEVAFAGNKDSLLLSMHGKSAPQWVSRDELWEILRGPVLLVSPNGTSRPLLRYVSAGALAGGIILLTILVVTGVFRRTGKLQLQEEGT